ncbi:MAG TPA: conjugal transfer protein TraG [Firmicutes bacterium]|jgi:type IV secretion system protein VirD4|nr:conjugal transfer protein TraG [Bacillota bacterium]
MKKYILLIIGATVIIYFFDVWILSIASSLLVDPASLYYYSSHPLNTSYRFFCGLFNFEIISNQDVFNTWKVINIGLLLIGVTIVMTGFNKPLGNSPFFKNSLLGSADWLNLFEAKKTFNLFLSQGILFGKHFGMPVVLPPSAEGNRNVAVLGPPGSMKSRGYVRNNLFQAMKSGWSVIVTDPKGELTKDFKNLFIKQGYKVKVFNLVDMIHSDRWNPLSVVKTDIDAQMFCEVVISNTGVPGRKSGDQFWDRAESNLLKALVLYVISEFPEEERNLGSLYKILASGDSKYLDAIFKALDDDHPAKMPFNIYAETDSKVRSGVIIGLGTRLQVFQNDLVRSLTKESDITLDLPGKEKCAYFCITSDMDRTFDFLSSLFFSFLFIGLTRLADRSGGELAIPVNFLLDEFCNIGHIPDFTKKISTMRGRGIACSVIFQSIVQLKTFYPDNDWETILADCDSWLVLGVKDVTSAKYISEHLGVGTIQTEGFKKSRGKVFDLGQSTSRFEKRNLLNPDEIIRMPRKQAILSAFGLKPLKLSKMDFTKHPMYHLLSPEPVANYKPEWANKYTQNSAQKELEKIVDKVIKESCIEEPGIYAAKDNLKKTGSDTFWS